MSVIQQSSGTSSRQRILGYTSIAMLAALSIVAAAAAGAFAVSYIMWRASSRSGLWGLIAGAVLAIVAFGGAVLIGLAITRIWFRGA